MTDPFIRKSAWRNSSWPGELISNQRPNTFAQTCQSPFAFSLQSRGGPYIHGNDDSSLVSYTLEMGLLQRAMSWYYARSVRNFGPGDVCSIKSEDRFSVAKILSKRADVVHVRIYREKFANRPESIEMRALSLGSINDPDGFGVGHIPRSCSTFGSWLPAKLRSDPVVDDELIWVTEWERSGGSVWS